MTKIRVTKEDIKRGIPLSRDRCPIARALQRASGGIAWNVGFTMASPEPFHVDRERIDLADISSCIRLPMPPSATQFMRRFDACKPVKPFTLEI